MTEAVTAQGTILEVQLDGTWEKFYELKASPEIGETAEEVDATHMDSVIKEGVKDIPSYAAALDFTMNAIPTGVETSNYDLIQRMSRNATYAWRITLSQMGVRVLIPKAQWSWRMGAGGVSTIQDIIISLIPKSAPVWSSLSDTYTVTYNANGGEGTMTDSETYDHGEMVKTKENTFVKTGATFVNWNTRADNSGTVYDENDSFKIYGDTELYAIWSE